MPFTCSTPLYRAYGAAYGYFSLFRACASACALFYSQQLAEAVEKDNGMVVNRKKKKRSDRSERGSERDKERERDRRSTAVPSIAGSIVLDDKDR